MPAPKTLIFLKFCVFRDFLSGVYQNRASVSQFGGYTPRDHIYFYYTPSVFEILATGVYHFFLCFGIHQFLKFIQFFSKILEICRGEGPAGGWRRRGFRISHGRRPTALVTWQGRRSEAEGVRGSGGWAILARV